MKLVRYGKPGKEKPGLIDSEGRLARSERSGPTSAPTNWAMRHWRACAS
jgi:hypothetical protein